MTSSYQIKTLARAARFLLIALALSCFFGCDRGGSGDAADSAAPVRVAKVEKGDMTLALDAVGNVQASASVAITPRVDGEIMAVNFTEGQDVLAGESILEIDPRPYAATLAEKSANLSKSRAQLRKARKDRERYKRLVENGYISREAYDQTVTDEAALAATVEADEAALRRAELDLSYCSIIAPISGRIGELRLHKGNMVKDNDTGPVCTIDTVSPCYAMFSVPEAHLPAVIERMKSGKIPVTATPIGGKPVNGAVTLVDNSVDMKTGAIRLRATFENKSHRLWPGQFVEIRLPLHNYTDALLVPTSAIETGREGSYVYVADAENRASYRKVEKLMERDGVSVVSGDLLPGELVVVEGQVRLAPQARMKIMDDK